MDRVKYNSCIAAGLRGKKMETAERRMEFCIISKTCSGKAKDREEAKAICSQPKPYKEYKVRRARGGESCENNAGKIAECVVSKLEGNDVYKNQATNINTVGVAVANALLECQCQLK
jgi:hypothetical protein